MKNELFKKLEDKDFVQFAESNLVKEVRKDYSVLVEFDKESNNIVIANFYRDKNNIFDGGQRFVLFSGECNDMTTFLYLINIINVEFKVKEELLGVLRTSHECKCGCKTKK